MLVFYRFSNFPLDVYKPVLFWVHSVSSRTIKSCVLGKEYREDAGELSLLQLELSPCLFSWHLRGMSCSWHANLHEYH